MNKHMGFWVQFLNAGKNNNQGRRVKSNLITKDSQIPILRGTSKDHKEAIDKNIGPDFRPIMGAVVGPNIGLSEVGSMIVRKIADHADEGLAAKSTEEVLNKFESFNNRRLKISPKPKKLIISSMDIVKYYPSILSAQSAKIIRRMWEESDLIIEGIDYDKLVRYLGVILKKEEVIEEAFEELLYTKVVKEKKKKRTISKKIGRKYSKNLTKKKIQNGKEYEESMDNLSTNLSGGVDTLSALVKKKPQPIKSKKSKTKTEWMKPKRSPAPIEERKLFGKALQVLLVTCMDNHIYEFANEIRIQKQGGPIGLKLTGEIADCLMIDWDKKLLEELKGHQVIPQVYTSFQRRLPSSYRVP